VCLHILEMSVIGHSLNSFVCVSVSICTKFKGDNTSRDLGELGQKSFRLVEWRGLHLKNLHFYLPSPCDMVIVQKLLNWIMLSRHSSLKI
jgi:hypothetical protein